MTPGGAPSYVDTLADEHHLAGVLQRAGIDPAAPRQLLHDRVWGAVWRIDDHAAGSPPRFAKQCCHGNAFEPHLLQLLERVLDTFTPRVVHAEGAWCVLEDAGTPIAETMPADDAFLDTWCDVQRRVGHLQRAAESHLAELVACGVPRVTLNDLDALFVDLVDYSRVAHAHLDDALTAAELRDAQRVAERVAHAAQELSGLDVPDTINHDDLHAWNVLESPGGALCVIDWGDAVVSHPFFHLTIAAGVVRNVTRDRADAREQQLRCVDAYLEAWLDLADQDTLRRSADHARALGPILRAECIRRGLALASPERLAADPQWSAWIPQFLRDVLTRFDSDQ